VSYPKRVKLYADTICPVCKELEEFLTERGVGYEKILVDEDPEGEKEFLKFGSDILPVLDIEGAIVVGFDQAAIEKALRERGIIRE
jgi:glutaredoxin